MELSIFDFLDNVNVKLDNRVMGMTEVSAIKLGLDIRAGYRLYIDKECIIVRKYNDRNLQYYGGFEYVDKEFRQEIGDYVIYTNCDKRVSDCLDRYYDAEENDKSKTFTLILEYSNHEGHVKGHVVYKNISLVAANNHIHHYKMHYHNVKVSLTKD